MGMLLMTILKANWQKAIEFAFLLAVVSVVAFQDYELKNDKAKLLTAAMVHDADQTRIASLAKQLQDQNDAVTALQVAHATKQQAVDKALVVAKVQQQKVTALLGPTNDKKVSTCQEAMPDVRTILKGLTQ
jgi:predicted negative regulator of RcsB-dependent stress response